MQLETTTILISSIAAGTADVLHHSHGLPGKWRLKSATYTPSTTDAASATNFTTLTLKKGAGGTAVSSGLTNATVAFTAGTPRDFTLLEVGTTREFESSDSLEIDKAEDGTGGILHGTLTCTWRKVR